MIILNVRDDIVEIKADKLYTYKRDNIDELRQILRNIDSIEYEIVGVDLLKHLYDLRNIHIFNNVLIDITILNRLIDRHSFDEFKGDLYSIENTEKLYKGYVEALEKYGMMYNVMRYYLPASALVYKVSTEPILIKNIDQLRQDLQDDVNGALRLLQTKGLSKLDMKSIREWVKIKYNDEVSLDKVAQFDDDVALALEGYDNIRVLQKLSKIQYPYYVYYDMYSSNVGNWLCSDVSLLRKLTEWYDDILQLSISDPTLYLFADLTQNKELIQSLKDKTVYVKMAEKLKVAVQIAQQYVWAVMYMASLKTLKRILKGWQIDKTEDELKESVKWFHGMYKDIKRVYYDVYNTAKQKGFITSMLGRRRYFDNVNLIGVMYNLMQMNFTDLLHIIAAELYRRKVIPVAINKGVFMIKKDMKDRIDEAIKSVQKIKDVGLELE